jgi:hypothetical protein
MEITKFYKSILSLIIKSEKYKEIKNFESLYIISNKGRIFRQLKNGILRELKWMKKPNGYYKVELYNNGKRKDLYIHRLVAEHFIPNDDPVNKDEVNHKKRNKKNNSVTNLIWVTRQENMEHYYKDRKKQTTVEAITELKKAWWDWIRTIKDELSKIKFNIALCQLYIQISFVTYKMYGIMYSIKNYKKMLGLIKSLWIVQKIYLISLKNMLNENINNCCIDTASGKALDMLASSVGYKRNKSEYDEELRTRIMIELGLKK